MSRKRYVSTDISLSGKIEKLAKDAGEYAVILWTWMIPHMDDWGRMEGESDKVFYTVTPRFALLGRTPEDTEKALLAMEKAELLQRYEVDGKLYIQVNIDSFYELQTYIPQAKRNEDKSAYPPPPPKEQRKVAQNSTEQQEVAQNTPSPSLTPSLSPSEKYTPIVPLSGDEPGEDIPKAKPVPYQEIVDIYNKTCTSLPKVRSITKARKRTMKARYDPKTGIDKFKELFEIAEVTPFLKGQNKNGWTATFDWLMNENNMAKVLEKQYTRGGFDNERCRGDTQAEVGPPRNSKFARYYENNGTN